MKKNMKKSLQLKLSKLRLTLFKRRMLMLLELQLKPLEQKPSPPQMTKKLPMRNPRLKILLLPFKRTSNKL
jgi:hypothetical protein